MSAFKIDKGHNSVKREPEVLVSVQLLSLNLACLQKVPALFNYQNAISFLDLCINILERKLDI